MAVQARFFVAEVSKVPAGSEIHGKVRLTASTKGPNNWSKWTPYGTLEMGTLNDEAMRWFDEHLGQDVALTIAEIPAGE